MNLFEKGKQIKKKAETTSGGYTKTNLPSIRALPQAFIIKDVRKKALFTLAMMALFVIGTFVPLPGINISYIKSVFNQMPVLGVFNLLSGGGLERMSFFALGISPYTTASIVLNLLSASFPKIKWLREDDKKTYERVTYITACVIGAFQAVGIMMAFGENALISTSIWNYLLIFACLMVGCVAIIVLGKLIDKKGIGNGISLIIWIGLVIQLPHFVINTIATFSANIIFGIISVLAIVGITGAIIWMERREKRIPVVYAGKNVGGKLYRSDSTFIPIKLNTSGVLPIIFAITLIQMPLVVAGFWPNSGFYQWYSAFMGNKTIYQGLLYAVVYAGLLFFLTKFSATIQFNVYDLSKRLSNNAGFIPGIRPGKPTTEYLNKALDKVSTKDGIMLVILSVIPILLTTFFGINLVYSTTGIMLLVSVTIETMRTVESEVKLRRLNY